MKYKINQSKVPFLVIRIQNDLYKKMNDSNFKLLEERNKNLIQLTASQVVREMMKVRDAAEFPRGWKDEVIFLQLCTGCRFTELFLIAMI